mmetsp:Transcript_13364/g.31629  ORF Transcript_13364/g.31629 Transcript_13364/m.31629 type:complete len:94 (+) Transcript_13364:101-382(+)
MAAARAVNKYAEARAKQVERAARGESVGAPPNQEDFKDPHWKDWGDSKSSKSPNNSNADGNSGGDGTAGVPSAFRIHAADAMGGHVVFEPDRS